MKLEQLREVIIRQTPSLEIGYGSRIPESVVALKAMTMFWQPSMDRDYKPPTPEDLRAKEKYEKSAAKARRGTIWRISHEILDRLDLSKSKVNLKKVYKEVEGK